MMSDQAFQGGHNVMGEILFHGQKNLSLMYGMLIIFLLKLIVKLSGLLLSLYFSAREYRMMEVRQWKILMEIIKYYEVNYKQNF